MLFVKYRNKRINLEQVIQYEPDTKDNKPIISFKFSVYSDDIYPVAKGFWEFENESNRDKALEELDKKSKANRDILDNSTEVTASKIDF